MRIPYRKPGKFSQMSSDPFLTEGKFLELKNKLERLKKSRPQAAADVSRLGELGDFSENAAYQFAKARLRGINNRILSLEKQLQQATIIKPHSQTEVVELGHTVTIRSTEGEKVYHILGSSETSPQKGIISHNSPVGSALMGRGVGDMVKIKLPHKEIEYTIIKIE